MQKNRRSTTEESRIAKDLLCCDQILTAEFQYVAQTAIQANEDRARVATFYAVTVGSLVAAILSGQIGNLDEWYISLFAALFAALSIAGVLILLQLARLRQAWFDSVEAMNQIKDFYVRHVETLRLHDAFRWRTDSLPSRFKPWSISSLLAIQVSLLGGITSGAAVVFAGFAWDRSCWGVAIITGLGFSVFQMLLYRRLLQ